MNIPAVAFGAILALLFLLAFILAWKATHQNDSSFNFESVFLDADGKTSLGRVSAFIALIVSTWAFVYLTLNDRLTEWFFAGYMAAWVIQGSVSKWLDKEKP